VFRKTSSLHFNSTEMVNPAWLIALLKTDLSHVWVLSCLGACLNTCSLLLVQIFFSCQFSSCVHTEQETLKFLHQGCFSLVKEMIYRITMYTIYDV